MSRPIALGAALTVRFLLELALLAGAALAAWSTFHGVLQVIASIAAPVIIAVAWGAFLSPKAAVAVHWMIRLVLETVLFVGVACWLFSQGHSVAPLAGIGFWALDRFTIWVLMRSSRPA